MKTSPKVYAKANCLMQSRDRHGMSYKVGVFSAYRVKAVTGFDGVFCD